MSLVVEDGTIVPGANSYTTVENARSFLSVRGIDLPADDDAVAALLIRTMDALDELAYQGEIVDPAQPLSFPRTGIVLADGRVVSDASIPDRMIRAQIFGAFYLSQGIDPSAVPGQEEIRVKVDVLELEYSDTGGENNGSYTLQDLPLVLDQIAPLLAVASDKPGATPCGYISRA